MGFINDDTLVRLLCDPPRERELLGRFANRCCTISRWLIWLTTLVFVVVDVIKGLQNRGMTLNPHLNPFLAWSLTTGAIVALICTIYDALTYQPHLFLWLGKARTSANFFEDFRNHSEAVSNIMDEIEHIPPASLSSVTALEENLLAEANSLFRLDRVKWAIYRRAMGQLMTAVLCLALLLYGMSNTTRGGVLRGPEDEASFVTHLYFTVATFFTIGFGDLTPKAAWPAYIFVLACAILLIIVSSFAIGSIVSAKTRFEDELRRAAHNYVLSKSRV